jgi:hypothetical protein
MQTPSTKPQVAAAVGAPLVDTVKTIIVEQRELVERVATLSS